MSGGRNSKSISSLNAENKLIKNIKNITDINLQQNNSYFSNMENNVISDLARFEKSPSLIIKSDIVFEKALEQGQSYEEAVIAQTYFADEFDVFFWKFFQTLYL